MTDEEKGALLQFMGTAYGDAHKQDQNIVGKSGQLQPISQHMKQEFEEVFNTPTHPHPQNALAPVPVQGPVASGPPGPPTGPISPVTVEQATKELNTAPPELQFDSNTVTHSQPVSYTHLTLPTIYSV